MTGRAVAHVVFRHLRLVLAVLALALALGGGWIAAHPRPYRAEAVLMVDGRQAGAAPALAALLASRDRHRPVVERFGARLLPGVPEGERVEAFGRALRVAPSAAGTVRLTLDGADGAVAAQALAMLIERARAAPGDDAAATRLAAYRRKSGRADPAAEREDLAHLRARLDAESTAAEAEAAIQADRAAVLEAQLAKVPATIQIASDAERSRVLEEARSKRFELETRERELLAKYQPSSPLVQAVEDEKRQVDLSLRQYESPQTARVQNGVNPVHQGVERDLLAAQAAQAAARSKAKALARQKAEVDHRLDTALDAEQELERAGAAPALPAMGVVDSAQAVARPVGPPPLAVLGAALGLGLAAALAAAGLAQRFSSRLATPAETERRLGLAVLTSIPREG
jgi:uncharacterized protein involved in exopolysaccharide biosynthesis